MCDAAAAKRQFIVKAENPAQLLIEVGGATFRC